MAAGHFKRTAFVDTHWQDGHWKGGEIVVPHYVDDSQAFVAGPVVSGSLVAGASIAEGFAAGAATQQGR